MKLLQKMAVFGSRVNIAAHGFKTFSARKKLIEELKKVISEKSGVDFGEDLKHYNKINALNDGCLPVSRNYYLANSYYKILTLLKNYRDAIEDLLFGAGRKFARKTDRRIEKATLQNKADDIKYLEEEKEDIGSIITEFMDDYEYYLDVFEKLNSHYGIKQEEDLSLN